MRRLTYSPKAYIFIRSSNLGGRIYDVSADVVNGSVTQNCGDVSTAQFVLRNRYKKWLKDPSSGMSIFLPMDLVTIWLQKLPGQPIQEFTGYLDSVPYYQGYPGNAPFTATCTLKKLAYTWFDPGLQFFQQWMVSNGWIFDPTSGQAINPKLNYATQSTTNGIQGTSLNDGGFGQLLGRFMIDIGQWDPEDVLISDLPPNIPKSAAALYKTVAADAEQSVDDLSTYLSNVMGVSVPSGSAGSTTTATGDTVTQRASQILAEMTTSATNANIPTLVLAYAAYVMTNFTETYSKGPSTGDQYGYGIYALRPTDNIGAPGLFSIPTSSTATIDGSSLTAVLDAGTSSDILCKRLNQNQGAWVQGARNNDVSSIQTWLTKAIGRTLPVIDPVTAFNAAKQFTNTSMVIQPTQGGVVAIDPNSTSWNPLTPSVKSLITSQEQTVALTYYQNHKPWLAALLYQAKNFSPDLRLAVPANAPTSLTSTQVMFAGPDSTLANFFNSLVGITSVDSVVLYTADTVSGQKANVPQVLQNGVASTFNGDIGNSSISSGILLTEASAPPAGQMTADLTNSATDVNSVNSTVSMADMGQITTAAAFAANFSFPTDIIESTLLTGQKALMNDMSCLDAVKQFAQASMRQFRSLPDGRFLGFYPDYFGAYRDPYHSVENIELVNFGIILSDDQLATHVYVTGDTMNFNNQVDFFEEITTAGVVTLGQNNILRSFIEPWDPDGSTTPVGQLADQYAFLEHYGARPYQEEDPIIRSSVFEFLLAYQRFMQKWASQFATTVDMTFQPEIMAGGLIAFPDHNVQMYVESVTHTFDYSAGFSTSVQMSAPSIPKAQRKAKPYMPGFALAGSTQSVGV